MYVLYFFLYHFTTNFMLDTCIHVLGKYRISVIVNIGNSLTEILYRKYWKSVIGNSLSEIRYRKYRKFILYFAGSILSKLIKLRRYSENSRNPLSETSEKRFLGPVLMPGPTWPN